MKTNINKTTKVLFALYLIILVWVILFKLQFNFENLDSMRSINLIPFAESYLPSGRLNISEIVFNIIFFIPFGIFMKLIFPKESFIKTILIFFGFSILLEFCQYIFSIGVSDITDVISNTFGGLIGLSLSIPLYNKLDKKYQYIINRLAFICIIAVVVVTVLLNL